MPDISVSTFRLYLLRAAYLFIAVGLAVMIWPRIINHTTEWALKNGDTAALLAGVQVLAMLGIRYPLKRSASLYGAPANWTPARWSP